MISAKKYSIQEIRSLISEFEESMNVYTYLHSAKGIKAVHLFLERIENEECNLTDKVNE